MNFRRWTFALRSLLLATALNFAGPVQSWSAGVGPPGGGGAPVSTTPEPGAIPPQATGAIATNNLITMGNSLFFILDPYFNGSTIQNRIYAGSAAVENLLFNNKKLATRILKDPSSPPAAVAVEVQLIAAALALANGTSPPWGPAAANAFGPWSSVVADAAGLGVSTIALIEYWAWWEITQLPIYRVLLNQIAPLQFTDEPASDFPEDIALAYASILKVPRAPPPGAVKFLPGWTAWASAYGGYNRTNGDPGVGAETARLYGSIVGLEYHYTPGTLLGFMLGGAGLNWGEGSGRGSSDALQFGVYGTTHFGAIYVTGLLDAALNQFNTTRFAAGDDIAAKYNAESYGARLETGYGYAISAMSGVAPYAALQLQYLHLPSYSETDLTGGGLGVNYNAMNTTDTRSELGARFDTLQNIANMPVILRARAAWAHDWLSNPAATAAFQVAPGASFIVNGAAQPSDSALGSLEAEMHLAPNWSLAARFDGQFASSSQTYLGTGTLRYTW
jgi:uncharacterized protein YhjY with autotransporter beta-barrel domain